MEAISEMIRQLLASLLTRNLVHGFRRDRTESARMFDQIIGYDGIKRTFARSLDSKEPVHILLVGPPGQAKTLFLKSILAIVDEVQNFKEYG